jgi:hypothetical protein
LEFEEWRLRGLKGIRLEKCEVGLVILQKQVQVGISFIDAFIKKIKRKIHLECVPRVYLKKI